MLMRTTPFYPRLSELNQTGLYTHWAGHLSALRYDLSAKHEYFAVRNSVGLFDTSPLFKYRITGPDSERFLAGVMTRDIRRCRPGHAFYTVWCDDGGYVLEDGVLFRHAEDDWLLTAAAANLGYLESLVGRLRVSIEDVSAEYGVLAIQGPRSRAVLRTLAPEVDDLPYFGLTPAKIGDAPVTISRTGYTGDLGFEVFVGAEDALAVLDRIMQAGEGHGLRPFGEDALLMLRIEAGLALMNVEFSSARLAFTDAVWVDYQEFERLHLERGLLVPKDENPVPWESMLYDGPGHERERVGYATSLMYSPILQRHIAMARVLPEYAPKGSTVHLEITVDHEYVTVPATTDRMPLFNPARKTGSSVEPYPISHRMAASVEPPRSSVEPVETTSS
jgi:aminomethyltransferase